MLCHVAPADIAQPQVAAWTCRPLARRCVAQHFRASGVLAPPSIDVSLWPPVRMLLALLACAEGTKTSQKAPNHSNIRMGRRAG